MKEFWVYFSITPEPDLVQDYIQNVKGSATVYAYTVDGARARFTQGMPANYEILKVQETAYVRQ